MGTPNEEIWPGVSQLPDYKPTFPQWSAQDLAAAVPNLDVAGVDFLHVRYGAMRVVTVDLTYFSYRYLEHLTVRYRPADFREEGS